MRLRHFLGGFAPLALFLLMLAAPGSEALAAKEVSRKPFSKFVGKSCAGSSSCTTDFGTVPQNFRFEITNVSCYLSIGNVNGKVLYWYFHSAKDAKVVGRIHLRPQLLGTSSTAVTYNANEQAHLVLPAGASMLVGMTRDSSTAGEIPNMDCTISGDKVKLK